MATPIVQSILKRSDLDYQTFTDSVSKFRVSTPESLIDTDFEYGLQSSKWETLQTVNNIPTFFSRSGDTPITLANVTTTINTPYVYVTTVSAHGFIDGSPFFILGLKSVTAEGSFCVSKVLSSTTFVYRAKYEQTITGSLYDANTSQLYPGLVYQGTKFTMDQIESIVTNEAASSTITVTTLSPHGFSSNTAFSLTNTTGRRTIQFNAATGVSGTTITTTAKHNLYNTMAVVYNNNGGATVSGLSSGTTYYIMNASGFTFQLSATLSPLTAISMTPGTGIQNVTTLEDSSDGSFYEIATIPSITSFTMNANAQVFRNVITFAPEQQVDMSTNTIRCNAVHKQITGAPVIYSNGGGTTIGGLVSGTTYYVIRVDTTSIKLASTRANAIAGTPIDFTSQGSGISHTLTFTSIGGEVFGEGFVTTSNITQVITGSNVNFLSYFKYGDVFRVVNPPAATSTYVINALQTANNYLEIDAHPFTTGQGVRFVGNSTANILNNFVYYVEVSSSTVIGLHRTPALAAAGSAATRVNISGVTVTSSSIQSLPLGSVLEVPIQEIQSSTKIKLTTLPTASLTNANYLITSGLYPFTDGYVYHRAHDGGAEIVPSNNPDARITRQTRRYFRYQPGKGIQCSLSVNFAAPIDIDYLSRSGTTATGRTRKPHRLTVGLSITIENSVSAYNNTGWTGVYIVTATPTVDTFQYTLLNTPVETVCGGYPTVKVNGWTGSRLRGGMFDDQNGMFIEYDGQNMYCVRRDSVKQLSGLANVIFNSQYVTKSADTNTSYSSQLTVGQYIVIRGMSYRVVYIESDNAFYVQPPYRGITEENVMISVTTDTRAEQSSWNLDTCDGSGPTGFVLDKNKIHMIYLDYSWYGAGKIRYGFKDQEGIVRYCHEFIHNNQKTTAYFRSGNLPGRYEVQNIGNPTWVPRLLHWGTAIIMDGRYDDDKAYLFTASANVLGYTNGDTIQIVADILTTDRVATTVYDPSTQQNVTAYSITTTGTTGNAYSNVQNIRSGTKVSGFNLLANTYTLAVPQKGNPATKGVVYLSTQPTATATTRTYTFGETTDLVPNLIPLVSIRLAPSVDSSVTGPVGTRELINRMQLRTKSVDIMATNDTEIRIILNGYLDNRNWVNATSPSLSQIVYHQKGDRVQDGLTVFSYRSAGGSQDSAGKRTSTVTSYDLTNLLSLGNCIQGGDGVYPDGPDVLTIAAVCLDTTGVSATSPYLVSARVTWAENQA